jgi:DNA polymerase-3 subunit epsilon
MDIVLFDLETTGTDVKTCKIVQIAAVKIDENWTIKSEKKSYVKPGIPIPKEASDVHGITDEMVKDKMPFDAMADAVHNFFDGCYIAGYNVLQFDIPVLQREFMEVGIGWQVDPTRILDAYAIYRHYVPHTLSQAHQHYCGFPLHDAHDAMSDVLGTYNVMKAQMQVHSEADPPLATFEDVARLSLGNRATLDGKLVWNDDGEVAIPFGKHAGKTLRELARHESGYLQWTLKQEFSDEFKNEITEALGGRFRHRNQPI